MRSLFGAMMHIIYIHQHFCTSEGSGGTRSYDVSRHLVSMGHKVTVICGVLDISGLEMAPWYRPFRRCCMDGFDVIICNVLYSNAQGFMARLWSFLWFAFLASIAAMLVREPDVVFATHTPLTVGIPGFVAARAQRVPFIFEVRDLWPESDIISGNLKENWFTRCVEALEVFLYAKADKILLVSPGFEKRLLERGYPRAKLRTVLLGADGDIFTELRPNVEFRSEYGLEGKKVAVYTGVHGRANGLDYVLDAAERLKDRQDVAFVLVGDGMEKPRLVRRAEEMGLTNVRFVDYVPKTELPGILAVCDIGLMILANVGERPVTPNKIFDYMFVGLPSIVNFAGPTIDMVRADGTGTYADPARPEDLAERVVYWAEHPDEAKAVGVRAREVAYAKYDRRRIAGQLAETFEQVRTDWKKGRPGRV
ncbi:MAG: glycosyltransferase family 4 protein [Phycisphaerae bacterium]|nr:glycosyltransferase family 4 protein [Phycisphaerae bacterium]